jgi:hypothetical protein
VLRPEVIAQRLGHGCREAVLLSLVFLFSRATSVPLKITV